MKKCQLSKNACKICFQSVSKKNGIQCEGACKKWVHFKCLAFTPGKIKDIKKGFIKIMCPCPDCSAEPKEYLVKPPFTCHNDGCPANQTPKCTSINCPVNNPNPCDKTKCELMAKSCPEKKQQHSTSMSSDRCLTHAQKTLSASCCCPPTRSANLMCTKSSEDNSQRRSGCRYSGPRCGGSGGSNNNKEIIQNLEEMCEAVGAITCHLRDLMIKMK